MNHTDQTEENLDDLIYFCNNGVYPARNKKAIVYNLDFNNVYIRTLMVEIVFE